MYHVVGKVLVGCGVGSGVLSARSYFALVRFDDSSEPLFLGENARVVLRDTVCVPCARQSFTPMADKALLAEVEVAAWCPLMDLLALVSPQSRRPSE